MRFIVQVQKFADIQLKSWGQNQAKFESIYTTSDRICNNVPEYLWNYSRNAKSERHV